MREEYFEFQCPSCGDDLDIPKHLSGKCVQCPRCDEEICPVNSKKTLCKQGKTRDLATSISVAFRDVQKNGGSASRLGKIYVVVGFIPLAVFFVVILLLVLSGMISGHECIIFFLIGIPANMLFLLTCQTVAEVLSLLEKIEQNTRK